MIFKKTLKGEVSSKFQAIRDDNDLLKQKQFIESLWEKFEEHADSNFLDQFHKPEQFEERFWELYLGSTLLDRGFEISSKDYGPDFNIKTQSTEFWIEAISTGIGKNEKLSNQNLSGWVPVNETVLRITNAFKVKYDKIKDDYLNNPIFPDHPVVIAINSGKIHNTRIDTDPPLILRSLFKIGNPKIVFNAKTGEYLREEISFQDKIRKDNKQNIFTDFFESNQYKEISGVIFSRVRPYFPNYNLGQDFIFVHNPYAKSKLEHGWLKCGKEYHLENEELKCSIW